MLECACGSFNQCRTLSRVVKEHQYEVTGDDCAAKKLDLDQNRIVDEIDRVFGSCRLYAGTRVGALPRAGAQHLASKPIWIRRPS